MSFVEDRVMSKELERMNRLLKSNEEILRGIQQDKEHGKSFSRAIGATFYTLDGKHIQGNSNQSECYVVSLELEKFFRDTGRFKPEHLLNSYDTLYVGINEDIILVAATVYAENQAASFDEYLALACATHNYAKASNQPLRNFLQNGGSYAFATSTDAFRLFKRYTPEQRNQNTQMRMAIRATIQASTARTDYSKGAIYWDHSDLVTNKFHWKRMLGIQVLNDFKQEYWATGLSNEQIALLQMYYQKAVNNQTPIFDVSASLLLESEFERIYGADSYSVFGMPHTRGLIKENGLFLGSQIADKITKNKESYSVRNDSGQQLQRKSALYPFTYQTTLAVGRAVLTRVHPFAILNGERAY